MKDEGNIMEQQFNNWFKSAGVEQRLKSAHLNSYGVDQVKLLLTECWAVAQSEQRCETARKNGEF